jgi:hypothetical protein
MVVCPFFCLQINFITLPLENFIGLITAWLHVVFGSCGVGA